MGKYNKRRALVLAICSFAAMPALAEPPSWAKGGKGEEHSGDRGDDREDHDREDHGYDHRGRDDRGFKHFEENHRTAVRDYYARRYEGHGKCPPGLAKKEDGCLPPGQAKRWEIGRPLPADVKRYSVPHELVVQIGAPPAGYKYVRVASDILMIAVATGMVADAIQDLGR
jgi:Ni/Co efflux regulator RcnB